MPSYLRLAAFWMFLTLNHKCVCTSMENCNNSENCSIFYQKMLAEMFWGATTLNASKQMLNGFTALSQDFLDAIKNKGNLTSCTLLYSKGIIFERFGNVLPASDQWTYTSSINLKGEITTFRLVKLQENANFLLKISCVLQLYPPIDVDIVVNSTYRSFTTVDSTPPPTNLLIYFSDRDYHSVANDTDMFLTLSWLRPAVWNNQPDMMEIKCISLDFPCSKCAEDFVHCELCGNDNSWVKSVKVDWIMSYTMIAIHPIIYDHLISAEYTVCAVRAIASGGILGEWSKSAQADLTVVNPSPRIVIGHLMNTKFSRHTAVSTVVDLSQWQEPLCVHEEVMTDIGYNSTGQALQTPFLVEFECCVPAQRAVPRFVALETEDRIAQTLLDLEAHNIRPPVVGFAFDWVGLVHYEITFCSPNDSYARCIYQEDDVNFSAKKLYYESLKGELGHIICNPEENFLIWTEKIHNFWSIKISQPVGDAPQDLLSSCGVTCKDVASGSRGIELDWLISKNSVAFVDLKGFVWFIDLKVDKPCECHAAKQITVEPDRIKRLSLDAHNFYWLEEHYDQNKLFYMSRKPDNQKKSELVRFYQHSTQPNLDRVASTDLFGPQLGSNSRFTVTRIGSGIKETNLGHISDFRAISPQMRILYDKDSYFPEISSLNYEMVDKTTLKVNIRLSWLYEADRLHPPVQVKAFYKKVEETDKEPTCEHLQCQRVETEDAIRELNPSISLERLVPDKFYYILIVVLPHDKLYYLKDKDAKSIPGKSKKGFTIWSKYSDKFPLTAVLISVFVPVALILIVAAILAKLLIVRWKLRFIPRIPKNSVELKEKLGEGHYCVVRKGTMKTNGKSVAAKLLKLGADPMAKKGFLQEAIILGCLKHTNVVKLLGICLEESMLILEFCDGQNLQQYLQVKGQAIRIQTLFEMAIQAADALCYLVDAGYIHRDISAKNYLLRMDSRGKFRTVCLADFGLAIDRGVNQNPYSTAQPEFPIRHAAPESFRGKFSKASDVYSFGIVLWEIFTFGKVPFGEITNVQELEALRQFRRSYNPPYVATCPPEVYELMMQCWCWEPVERLPMKKVHHALKTLANITQPRLNDATETQSNTDQNQQGTLYERLESCKTSAAEPLVGNIPMSDTPDALVDAYFDPIPSAPDDYCVNMLVVPHTNNHVPSAEIETVMNA